MALDFHYIDKYINANIPVGTRPVYNDIRWSLSVSLPAAAGEQVTIPLNKNENRAFIIVHYIWVNWIACTGHIYDTDLGLNNAFIHIVAGTVNTLFPLPYIKKGPKLQILFNATGTNWSMCYQTVTLEQIADIPKHEL